MDDIDLDHFSGPEPFLTTAQAADLLGLSRGTVTTMAQDGRLPGSRVYRTGTERATIRIPRSAVQLLIARSLDPDADWDEADGGR